MFTNYTWRQILGHIPLLPKNLKGHYLVFTYPHNAMHYVTIIDSIIYTASGQNPNQFSEIPQRIFEAIYNELERHKTLPNKQCPQVMQLKFADVILAILAQLPEARYDKNTGILIYTEK